MSNVYSKGEAVLIFDNFSTNLLAVGQNSEALVRWVMYQLFIWHNDRTVNSVSIEFWDEQNKWKPYETCKNRKKNEISSKPFRPLSRCVFVLYLFALLILLLLLKYYCFQFYLVKILQILITYVFSRNRLSLK